MIKPTITVLNYLRSIAVNDRVASDARTASVACGMSGHSYGACLNMLLRGGALLDPTRDRIRNLRFYRIAQDVDIWVHDHTRELTHAAKGGGIIWTSAMDDRLRTLWSGSDSASEIGKKMGRGKSSIIGRAHRMKLPSRVAPIVRSGPGKPVAAPRPVAQPVLIPPVKTYIAPVRRSVTSIRGAGHGLVIGPPTVWRPGYCRWALACTDGATRGFFCDHHNSLLGRRAP